jgi:hypothetical protein
MNHSQLGMGIAILFPNGASLATNNDAGALNVTTEGRILSNSLDPSIANHTWVAVIPVGQGHLSSHPSSAPSSGQAYNWRFISWDLQKSAL